MPTRPTLILLSLPILAIPIAYCLRTHPSSPFTPPFSKRRPYETIGIPSSFARSHTLRQLVNPRYFTENAMHDTRTLILTRSEVEGLSDEEILARFTRGFFGGWAFFIERIGLTLLGKLGWRVAGPAGTGFIG